MGRAKIIEDLGEGRYRIQRLWAPYARTIIEARITAFRAKANELQIAYDALVPTTQDELFDKHVLGLQIESLKSKANYLENNMPTNETIEAWCADYSEGITGHPADVADEDNPEQNVVQSTVGTIDIPGEYTDKVNIRPTVSGQVPGDPAWHDLERDGDLWPSIALGAWTSFLNQCIYPGWQKFKPLHRYGVVVEGSINNSDHTCTINLEATLSSQQRLNVNQAETIESVPIEYMDCNSLVFEDGDEVVIEFTGQNWNDPKVIGFKEEPRPCSNFLWSMFGGDPTSITAYSYSANTDAWAVGHGEINYYDLGDPDYSGLYYFYVPGSFDWSRYAYTLPDGAVTIDAENGDLRFPVITRHQPMVTYDSGYIFSFGGWFNNGDYFPDYNPSAYTIDTCEKFNPIDKTWLQRNKDQYIGRSYGAAWVLNNKHYIACGSQYDERINSFFPHIDLNSNYIYGSGECPGTPGGPGAVQQVNFYAQRWVGAGNIHDPEYLGIQCWMKYYQVVEAPEGVFTGSFVTDPYTGKACHPFTDAGGRHRSAPSDDRPYWISLSDIPPYDTPYPKDLIGLYWWVNGSATWGKQWYSNQIFGECLEFDDSTNAYTQKTQTTATMMPGQFTINNEGYMCGGTLSEIANLINSADASGITNNVRKYLATGDSWQSPSVLPYGLLNPSGFEINGKGYIFSGYRTESQAGSTQQDFGREQIILNLRNVHPEGPAYRGSGCTALPVWLPEKILAGEAVALFCTNDLLEYDPTANTWTEKQRASTPTGNCRYREYYNHNGSITDDFYYGFVKATVEYERHDGTVGIFPSWKLAKFEKAESPWSDFYELQEPGPYYSDEQSARSGSSTYGVWHDVGEKMERPRKLQHIYKYPAYSHNGIGYVTSGAHVSTGDPIDHVYNRKEPWTKANDPGRSSIHIGVEQHMSSYNPLTDAWTVKSPGIKEHLSGGMISA